MSGVAKYRKFKGQNPTCTVCNLYIGGLAGEYVRFQPRTADFQKEVGPDVRAVLEAALERHSTLSEGDWISIPFADRTFDLTVQKLRPGRAVSVIGESAPLCQCAQMLLVCRNVSL